MRLEVSLLTISSKVAIAACPMISRDGGSSSTSLLSRTAAWEEELPDRRRVQVGPQLGNGRVVVLGDADRPLLDPAGGGDQDQQQPGAGQGDQLDMPDRGVAQRRVLHDGHLMGHLSEQPDRTQQHVVQVDRTGQEGLDGPLLGGRERLDRAQAVDEQPVTLVGGDASRAGVRLGDVTLFLQRGHVVADRGRGDTQVMLLHQRLGADRLLAGDVVGHDGPQHIELAVVHGAPPPSRSRVWHSPRPSASLSE